MIRRWCWVVLLTGVLILDACSSDVGAWGPDGHHITCLLAEPLLTPKTTQAVRSLLPEYANGSLASLCTWADDIRWQWRWHWTSPLHYIDTPDFLCRYDYDRDCHNENGEKDMCVSGAISNYTNQLTSFDDASKTRIDSFLYPNAGNSHYNLTEALLFLAHFVGDIHQPLHVGFTSDLGGNTIMVHWYTRKYNLHHIWDSEFINRVKKLLYDSDISLMAEALYSNITNGWSEDAGNWSRCPDNQFPCPDVYASESISLACRWAYRNATSGSTLQDEYYLSRLPIVEQRLAQGGVRLAATLNHIFDSGLPSL